MGFLGDFWALLSVYKLRAHDVNGKETFSIPLSWLLVLLLLCLVGL